MSDEGIKSICELIFVLAILYFWWKVMSID